MRKKVISLLLCASLALTILIPSGLIVGAVPPVTANGLVLSKTATSNGNGSYKIHMEAYTTGDVTITQSTVPTDFVLVLDKSSSMDEQYGTETKDVYNSCSGNNNEYMYQNRGDLYIYENGTYYKVSVSRELVGVKFKYTYTCSIKPTEESYTKKGAPPSWNFYLKSTENVSKFDALKVAANKFVDSVYANAQANSINHRISLVSYSNLDNDDAYTDITLQDGDVLTQKDTIESTITNLELGDNTYINNGLSNAKTEFDNNNTAADKLRNRVVIAFTDGIPGDGIWNSDNITYSANPAISISKALKSSLYNAKVYSIGIFTGADASSVDTTTTFNSLSDNKKSNRFLQYLSSNFPNATNLNTPGAGGSNQGYYLSASNVAALNSVFQKISTTTLTPTIDLNSSTIVKDIVSPYFELQNGVSTPINISTANCTGKTGTTYNWAAPVTSPAGVTATINGADNKTVNVTGFDFSSNFVTGTAKPGNSACPYGKKLIIEFNVVPTTFGGNQIPTNADTSGVYKNDGTLVANFDVPKVDVPINYNFDTQNQSIYVSKTADLSKCIKEVTGFSPNGINNAFVNIVYTIKQGATSVGTYTIPAGSSTGTWSGSLTPALTDNSTNYTVSCTVTPTISGTIPSSTIPATPKTATVYVFKPTITAKDTRTNYGTSVNLNNNIDNVTWNNAIPGAPTPKSSNPTLTYEYKNIENNTTVANPTNYTASGVGNFNISEVKADGSTIYSIGSPSNNATIIPATCSTNTEDHASGRDFTIHMNKFNLVINKKVNGSEPIDQVFIIKVKGNSQTFNVTIDPNDFNASKIATKTIVGLYCGQNYTVTEDKNWSWRYTPDSQPQTGTATANGDTKTVTIENNLTNKKWLSGEAKAENTFGTVWSKIISIFD